MTKELRENQKVKIVLATKHRIHMDLTEMALTGCGDRKVLVSDGSKIGGTADSSSRVGIQKSPDNDNRKKNKVAEQAFFSSNMDKNTKSLKWLHLRKSKRGVQMGRWPL